MGRWNELDGIREKRGIIKDRKCFEEKKHSREKLFLLAKPSTRFSIVVDFSMTTPSPEAMQR